MKRVYLYSTVLASGLLLASCGTDMKSQADNLKDAMEKDDRQEVVSILKNVYLLEAENEVAATKYYEAKNAAFDDKLITKAEIKEVDEYVKTEMSKEYEAAIAELEKMVEQYQATIEEVKKGSVSAIKKRQKQEDELIEKVKPLYRAAKYLQEPQVNRLDIVVEKLENADKSVREKAKEELAAVAKASK
ncbi:MAG: hypothetical protein MSS84_04325 [Bacteroidales bacterium]|nr:hypothetical protein [Bacteroidales bacterium]